MADDYLAQRAEQARGELQRIGELWKPLAGRIQRIKVRYDGYGDEGNIESIEFFSAHNHPVADEGPEADELRSALEEYCDEVLPGGWEINDGAFGTISLDWQTGQILIEHNDRYTDYTTTETHAQLGGS